MNSQNLNEFVHSVKDSLKKIIGNSDLEEF